MRDQIKIEEQTNISFLIQLANDYARKNEYFKLAKLVKDTQPILKNHRAKLHPLVNKVLDHYQKYKREKD
mgnify:FL=1